MEISSPSIPAIVRLMPSTATEPLCTIHWRTFSGTRTLRVQSVVSGLKSGREGETKGSRRTEFAGAVNMPLNDVAAERAAGGGGQFEVDFCAGLQRAERCPVQGFLGEVGMKVIRVDIERGEADAGDGERIAFAQAAGDAGASTVMRRTPPRSVRLTRVPVCSMMPVNMDSF